MKGSKNRKRLTQVEAIYVFLYINKQEILIHYDSNRFILLSKLGFLNTFDCLFLYAVSSIFLFVIGIYINCNLWPNVTIPIYGQQNRKLSKHLIKTNCKASITVIEKQLFHKFINKFYNCEANTCRINQWGWWYC